MDAAVHLRAAVCLLGRFPALTGLDLTVAPGEVVLIRGANGSGKTTLLRALAGLLPFTAGEAVVLGHDLRRGRRDIRSRVGLLGHGSPLYDDLTVSENARFWTRASRRTDGDGIAALERIGVHPRLHGIPAGRLSAGQRRRVAIALLLARGPDLWLLDEPHAGLDAASRDLLDGLVGGAAAGGATVLLASHEDDRAAALAGRTLTLAGGRVAGTEPPASGSRTETVHVA